MNDKRMTTREQDEYGYWYTRVEGPDGFLAIRMDQADVERMMAYQLEHPKETPESLSVFARAYEKLANVDVSKLAVVQPKGQDNG